MKWTSNICLLLAGLVCVRASSQGTPADAMIRDMLAAHNKVRTRVGVPSLVWSDQLQEVAQQWADSLLASGEFRHRPKNSYGENLCDVRGGRASPDQVVDDWTAEAKDYDPEKNTCRVGAVCGHYTQVVWRNTRKVGCAAAHGGGREVWVCNYDPPGNWVRERPY